MAYPVTLNGRTYTLADFEGTNYVEGLPDAFEDFVTHAGDIYNDTSTTSNSIGTGSKTFTVSSGKPYQAGTPLRIADAAAPSTNFMDTVVTSYSGTSLVVNSIGYGGSGTKTSWTINIGGAKTIDGTLGVSQGGTGATTAAAARTNLDVYSKADADSRFLNVSGEASDVTMTGNVTIGDAGTDTLTINAATTTTADINFGDNDKAIFGAGSDLQIYHDGSNSIISDQGTGSINLLASNYFRVKNSADSLLAASFRADAGQELYHNSSLKFATTSTGVDITGTLTSDALTVDNSGTAINITNGDGLTQLGKFSGDATNGFVIEGKANNNLTLKTKANTLGEGIKFVDTSDNNLMFIDGTTGDISFYEDTGTTAKFFWDASAEALGLGTTSPTNGKIEILNSTDGYESIRVSDSRATPSANKRTMDLRYTGTNGRTASNTQMLYLYDSNASSTQPFIQVDGSSSTHLVLDSSGNVGIGTSSPIDYYSDNLVVSAPTENGITIAAQATTNTNYLMFADGTTGDERYRGYIGYLHSTDTFSFGTSGTEAMRIDSSGNLLVGKTSTGISAAGHSYRSDGTWEVRRDLGTANSSSVGYLSRGTTDGNILTFYKNTASVGSIGVEGADLTIGNGDVGIGFVPDFDAIRPMNMSTNAIRDAAIDLGRYNDRFKDLYLSGGVYLGGTGSANKLDDYEEGTWTPVINQGASSVTYSVQAGSYTKIGQLVVLNFQLSFTAWTGTADNTEIGGFPFIVYNNTDNRGQGSLLIDNLASSQNHPLLQANIGQSEAVLLANVGGTGSHTGLTGNQLSASTTIRGSIFYRTSQ